MGWRVRSSALAAVLCAAMMVAAVTANAKSAGAESAGGESRATLSFRPPAEAAAGDQVVAQGRVSGLGGRGTLRAQLLNDGRWQTLARRGVGDGRFRVQLTLPAVGAKATLRAVVLVAGERVATSGLSRVLLLAASPAGPPAPTAPASGPSTAAAAANAATAAPPSGPIDNGPAPPAEEPPVEEPPAEEPPDSLYWGAWINPGTPVQPAPIDPTAISQFESVAGKSPSILESYSAFFQCDDGSGGACAGEYAFPQAQLEAIRQRGAIPLFTWASESSSGQVTQSNFELADVAGGKWDTYVRKWATAAKAWGHPFFLRFDWEMNGNWFPWGQGVNGNQAGQYVAAWRHVHDVFAEVGATNATWVWCPFAAPRPLAGFYPGDQYVDWTCLDGYNNTLSGNWRSFSQIFSPAYKEVTETIAPSKPMMIAEVASAEANAPPGSSKAQWITQMFDALPTEFPAVRALLWFDYEEGGKGWPLETSPAAEDAFAVAIADPRFLTNTFSALTTSPIPPP